MLEVTELVVSGLRCKGRIERNKGSFLSFFFSGIHPPPGSYEHWDIKRLEPKQSKSSDEKDGIAKSMLEGGLSKPGTVLAKSCHFPLIGWKDKNETQPPA